MITTAEFQAMQARLAAAKAPKAMPAPVTPPAKAKAREGPGKRVAGLNKTEREWKAMLESRGYVVHVQSITLTLAERCTYTPDFWALEPDGTITLWDSKGGHVWEDSIIKQKTAAAMFPMFKFVQAQKKGGKWTEKTWPA